MKPSQLWMPWMGLLGLLAVPALSSADNPPGPVAAPAAAMKLLSEDELAAFIDAQVEARWQQEQVVPAQLADDAEFLRRAYLDIAGRIPRVADARSFLSDKSSDRRQKLVEKLLAGPQYVEHFSNTWRSLIIPSQGDPRNTFLAANFQVWLSGKVRSNTGFDRIVYDVLTSAQGSSPQIAGQPAFNRMSAFAFYQANELKPENLAATTSRVFLGIRLECAQCHDHPFNSYTREQFWEFAAFFANTRPVRVVRNQVVQPPPPSLRTITIPGKKKTVSAHFVDGTEPNWEGRPDPRAVLAEWVTSPQNPYFSRTTVNRLWAHFFGLGLNDPVDDEPTPDNPPSHPELLAELSRQFAGHKFDVKYIIRAITRSKTYQRTSALTHESQKEPRLFARMAVRGLTPEQLFDSLARAIGYLDPTRQPGQPVFVNQRSPRTDFLTRFASSDREVERQTSILQALTLMNGRLVADATSLEKSKTLTAVAEAPFFDTPGRIDALYLATLTRHPRQDELDRLTAYVNGGGPRHDSRAALADVFWALLNSSEFFLNH
jgi:hypothetical protein